MMVMAFFRAVGTLFPPACRKTGEIASHAQLERVIQASAKVRMVSKYGDNMQVAGVALLAAGMTFVIFTGGWRWIRARAGRVRESVSMREFRDTVLDRWASFRHWLAGLQKAGFLYSSSANSSLSVQNTSHISSFSPMKTNNKSVQSRKHRDSTMFTYLGKGKNRMTVELCISCVETNRLLRQLATDAGLEYDKYEPCAMCKDRLQRLECVQTGQLSPTKLRAA